MTVRCVRTSGVISLGYGRDAVCRPAGMDLIRLSLLLGHEDPATTQRYYVAAEQMKLSDEVRQIASMWSCFLTTGFET